MDFENNGSDSSNFINKVKKQAKRLFQLSKNNQNNLQINSLSQAQELLAKINGYPDWHALEVRVNNSKSILIRNNESKIELHQCEYGYLHYLETEDSLTTFFRFNFLPGNIKELTKMINSFDEMFSFQMNMGIHDMSVFCNQENKKYEKENSYSLYEISKSFNLSEEEAKKLFYIDKSLSKPFYETDLTIYLIVTTKKKHKEEHINLNLSILNLYSNLESIPYLYKEDLENFRLENANKNELLSTNLFSNKKNNELSNIINKWVYLLNFLFEKKVDFSLKISIIEKTIEYKFNKYENNKDLIDAFINSAIKTEKFAEQNFKYLNKPIYNYNINNETKGVTIKSKFNNKTFNYNDSSNIRTSHIDLIYGLPGSGKSVLSNMITLSSILDKDVTNLPRIGIIDVGQSYKGMIDLVKNILPMDMKNAVQQFNIKNTSDYVINPFDLLLGKRQYDILDIQRITEIFKVFFKDSISGLHGLLQLLFNYLNELPEKLYKSEENLQIDSLLKKLGFITTKTTTWWNIVDFLFINGFDELATKAQRFATPVLNDILPYLEDQRVKDIYKNINVETGENLIDYVSRSFLNLIKKYPFINESTKLELYNVKIAYFNLDAVCSFKEEEIQSYWFAIVLDAIKYKLLSFDSYSIYSSELYGWKENWNYYLNKKPISLVYNYYNYSKRNNYGFNKIIIDEFYRFAYSSNIIKEQVTVLLRVSRKYGVGISILSQSLDDFESFKDFATAIFVSQSHRKEEKLLNYGFEQNEINLMKNIRFPSWAVKLITNRGKMFDIIDLEMTDYLNFALSTTVEDLIIKQELGKILDYMDVLKKSVNYLKSNKSKSFKNIFEKMKESDEDEKKFIPIIIKDIMKTN